MFEITVMTASNPVTESKQAAVLLHMEEKLKVCFLFHLRNQQLSVLPYAGRGPDPHTGQHQVPHPARSGLRAAAPCGVGCDSV